MVQPEEMKSEPPAQDISLVPVFDYSKPVVPVYTNTEDTMAGNAENTAKDGN